MNANRFILLLNLMVLFPIFASGQNYRPPTKREAEQIGKKTYILSNGDTTKVVNTVGSGLRDSYSNFLFRKTHTAEVDSIFSDSKSDYSGLEEAALDVDKLLREVDLEKKLNSGRNDALAFRLARDNRNRKRKEQAALDVDKLLREVDLEKKLNSGRNDALAFRLARDNRNRKRKEQAALQIADSLLKNKDSSIQELTSMYVEFDGKPTYYINGVEVDRSFVNQLYPQEVIKREMRVNNTASGNPYGEVWILVPEKTLGRLKIPVYLTNNYIFENTTSATVADPTTIKKRTEPTPLPVIRREITADGRTIDTLVPKTESKDKGAENASDRNTKVLSRTVNNQKVETSDDAVITSDPTYNNVRRSQPVIKRSQPSVLQQNIETKEKTDNTEKNSEPKKSVRRIKEKQQLKD